MNSTIDWSHLPVNNVTGDVPKLDSEEMFFNMDIGIGDLESSRPIGSTVETENLGEYMTPESRRQYINAKRERYRSSSCRKERGLMLQQLVQDGIYKHVKAANRAMLAIEDVGDRIHERGRKAIYCELVIASLKRVWLDSGQPNSIRLKSIMRSPYWMTRYNFSFDILESLKKIGKTSIDKFTKPWRVEIRRQKNTMTKPGDKKLLKGVITQRVPHVKVEEPGFVETDTVCHSGGYNWGDYGYTVNTTDIFTGWTQSQIMRGKSAIVTVNVLEVIFSKIPIEVKSIYFDSGTEFLNYEMVKKFGDKKTLQHSRPQKKNDQAFIEQKNNTHVRQLLGYSRVDTNEVINAINDLYDNEWSLLNNYFMPQMKLIEKTRVGSKLKKKYDTPKTPLERLIEAKKLSAEKTEELIQKRDRYDPVELRKIVDKKVKAINELIQLTESKKKAG